MSNRLAPYHISNGIQLTLKDPVDLENPERSFNWEESPVVDESTQRVVDLRGDDWSRLSVQVEARLPPDEIADILPTSSSIERDARMALSVRCPATKFRFTQDLQFHPDHVWRGDFQIDHRLVRNRLEILPILHRVTDAVESKTDGKAHRRDSLIAWGWPVLASLDAVPKSIHGPVRIRWADFGTAGNEWRLRFKGTIYHLEILPDEPILWLNTRASQLRPLLMSATDSGPTAAIRQLLVMWLSETVNTKLFYAALAAAAEESQAGTAFPSGWQGSILRGFLPVLFPEISEPSSALERALGMRDDDANTLATLLSLMSSVVQDHVGAGALLQSSVRAMEKKSRSENASRETTP